MGTNVVLEMRGGVSVDCTRAQVNMEMGAVPLSGDSDSVDRVNASRASRVGDHPAQAGNSPATATRVTTSPPPLTRNLNMARAAHRYHDVQASITAHTRKAHRDDDDDNDDDDGDDDATNANSSVLHSTHAMQRHSAAVEKHSTSILSDYIKSIVFGGVDGIITTFAIVAGTTGAGLSTGVVIVLGVSNLIADGISMG